MNVEQVLFWTAVGFYGLAAQRTTESEVARVEDVIAAG